MLVLTNVTLIDGTGGKPIQKATVVIRGNRFEHVGSEISYPLTLMIWLRELAHLSTSTLRTTV